MPGVGLWAFSRSITRSVTLRKLEAIV
jgi:hypothetical protein